jgi:hypothetical protein
MERDGVTPSDRRPSLREAACEIALMLCLVTAYFLTRGLARGSRSTALDHAQALLGVERAVRLDLEQGLQHVVLPHGWLVDLANALYVLGHLPVLAIVAVWLFWAHPRQYRFYRTAFLISAALALAMYIVVPLAPPRFLPGFVDTERLTGFDVDGSAVGAFYNPYAAMPSLHVGWSLLAAIAVIGCTHNRWVAAAAGVLPVLMTLASIATGNHFVLDAPAGIAVVLCALFIAARRYRLDPLNRNNPR